MPLAEVGAPVVDRPVWTLDLPPLSAPDFARAKDGLGEDERAAFVHAFNVWNYAVKVRELTRAAAEIRPLVTAAEIADNGGLMVLAAEIAAQVGRADLSYDLFVRATELGVLRAHLGAATVASQQDRSVDGLSHLAAYLTTEEGASRADLVALHAELMPLLSGEEAAAIATGPTQGTEGDAVSDVVDGSSSTPVDGTRLVPEAALVRLSGRVDRVWPRDRYGFIVVTRSTGPELVYFSFDALADANLRRAVESEWHGQVTFVQRVEPSRSGGTRRVAVDVRPTVPIILAPRVSAPPSSAAKRQPAPRSSRRGGRVTPLQSAKRLELDRDLDGAERLYREAVAAGGPDAATAVKELAWLLNRKEQWREAIALLDEHMAAFGRDTRPVDNLRLHILAKGKQYSDMRVVISKLMKTANPRQRLTLLKQDVTCLIGLSDFDEAERILDEGLRSFPGESSLVAMRDRLAALAEEPDAVDLVSLQDLSTGVDDFARFYLENPTMAGADERVKARGDFIPADFDAVSSYLNSITGRRPKDRAPVMLTMAHMAWKVPLVAGDQDLGELLRRYFSLMAEGASVSAADQDTVRTFAAEALAHCRPEQVSREVPVLLASYLPAAATAREDKWAALAEAFDEAPSAWHDFLAHLPYYEARCSELRAVLGHHLVRLRPALEIDAVQTEERAGQIREIEVNFRSLVKSLDGGAVATPAELQLIRGYVEDCADEALFQLDRRRFGHLAHAVDDVIAFLSQTDFVERRASYERARSVLQAFVDQIDENATRIGVVGLRSFAERLLERVESDQLAYLDSAAAHLTVTDAMENDYYQLEANSIRVPLLVGLAPGDPFIEDVTVEVDTTDGLDLGEPMEPIAVLHAGKAREIRLKVVPTKSQIAEKAFTLSGKIRFNALGKDESWPFSLPIRLDTETAFQTIDNPFESYAGGSIVSDPAMFYGRRDVVESLVKQVTDGPLGQCYVLYGQKRSGKSSVLEQVKERLADEVITVKLTMGEIDTADAAADYSFLRVCITELQEALRDRGEDELVEWPDLGTRLTLDSLKGVLRSVQRALADGSGAPRIVYLIDEFTYIYGYVKTGIVERSFMRQWKALMESRLVNTVVVGQDSMPRFMAAFPNEFGVTKSDRLTYLSQSEARDLATDPILLNQSSRYRGRSIERLLELTGCSPWFLQIMCSSLVKHLNREHAPLVTESDVDAIARALVSGDQRLGEETFDPLITAAGDTEDEFPREAYLDVLRQVAWQTADRQAARPSSILLEAGVETTQRVLDDLIQRDVLTRTAQGNLRIRVGLFDVWLRTNRPIVPAERG
ncbi:MAG: hypothetical protein QM572_15010 [Nocardioides sp.]|uniref:AAA family ATPase n=1 Tax=Nocardioides sp. TaxID=35761 RepID=UPI0039E5ED30